MITNDPRRIRELIIESISKGMIVGAIDREVSSFLYMEALKSLGSTIKNLKDHEYVWIVSYEPLRSLLRDLERAGVDYNSYLGKKVFVLDVFGSMRKIEPNIKGVYVLSGYLDDNVFVLKYRSLISDMVRTVTPTPKKVITFGYLESGMCRLFNNPVKTQKRLWNLKEEVQLEVPGIITCIHPECPRLEEFIYAYSDVVIEGYVEGRERKFLVSKGGDQ